MRKDRRRLADVLTAIRLRTTVDALGHAAEPNAGRHLKPPAEMARLFADHPEAIANTLQVLEPVLYSAPSPEHGERVPSKTLGVVLFQEQAMRPATPARRRAKTPHKPPSRHAVRRGATESGI